MPISVRNVFTVILFFFNTSIFAFSANQETVLPLKVTITVYKCDTKIDVRTCTWIQPNYEEKVSLNIQCKDKGNGDQLCFGRSEVNRKEEDRNFRVNIQLTKYIGNKPFDPGYLSVRMGSSNALLIMKKDRMTDAIAIDHNEFDDPQTKQGTSYYVSTVVEPR